jgi:ubiquinone/menaquinone biosynthesis C-methylase UbiE
MLARLARHLFRRPSEPIEMDPASGYDLWSSTYDEELGNLLVARDDVLFAELLERVRPRGKIVVDIGCGTGRHWRKILRHEPAELVGYDVSAGMLERLRAKYPGARTYQASAEHLDHTRDETCDLAISTLALCHVPDVASAVAEWSRVLRPGGDVLVTDFHPAAASNGVCSFRSRGELVTVELHAYTLAALVAGAARLGLLLVEAVERVVDESMRQDYEARGMVPVFERMRGVPLLYGLHLRKLGAVSP